MPAPFSNFTGIAAPLPLANVNTDAIIPAAFLRSTKADLAAGLFARWRFDEAGNEVPEFVLNRPACRGATILLAGPNFGCGSSREAAAWALVRSGFRCVAAPSFADIFYENAFRNGLLAAIVSPEDLARAAETAESAQAGALFSVDLPAATLTGPDGRVVPFAVPDFRRDALLRGDDEIATTLRFVDDIADFVARDRLARPWIHHMEERR
jgi:3-isopropylmalate/(R)-2-methylmalate dehydratase small subunit